MRGAKVKRLRVETLSPQANRRLRRRQAREVSTPFAGISEPTPRSWRTLARWQAGDVERLDEIRKGLKPKVWR